MLQLCAAKSSQQNTQLAAADAGLAAASYQAALERTWPDACTDAADSTATAPLAPPPGRLACHPAAGQIVPRMTKTRRSPEVVLAFRRSRCQPRWLLRSYSECFAPAWGLVRLLVRVELPARILVPPHRLPNQSRRWWAYPSTSRQGMQRERWHRLTFGLINMSLLQYCMTSGNSAPCSKMVSDRRRHFRRTPAHHQRLHLLPRSHPLATVAMCLT